MANVSSGTLRSTPPSNGSNDNPPPGGRPLQFPIDPNRWYSVQEVALRYGTGDDFVRRTFRARRKNGHEGIKDKYEQKPGIRRWGFVRIKGSALLAWEQE